MDKMVGCENCGRELEVEPVEKPEVDWVKVVCSNCGEIRDVSMVRLSATVKQKE